MNRELYSLLNFLTILPQYPLIAWFTARFIRAKHPYIYMLAFSVPVAASYVLTQNLPAAQWICTLILFIVPLLIFSRIPRGLAVMHTVIGIALMIITELPSDYILQFFYPGVTAWYMLPPRVLFVSRILSLPPLAVVWAFNNWLCGKWFHIGYKTEMNRYLPIMGVECVILFAITVIYQSLNSTQLWLPLLFLITILAGLLLLDLLLIRTVRRLDTAHDAELEQRQTMELLRSQALGYKAFCENTETVRRLRTGMTDRLRNIAQLLDSGDTAAAGEQLDLYIDAVSQTGKRVFTGNPVADAVINNKTGIMEEAGITFANIGSLPKDLAIDPARLCALTANLLDNAIRGCSATPEDTPKTITLHEGLKNDRLILRCENTCPADTKLPDADPATLNSEHGWGLGILRRIAEDSGGDAVFDCAGTTFTAVIQLQLQKTEEV